MLRKMGSDAGVAVEVSSAGTWAEVRQGMYPDTAACALEHGLDGTGHVSRMLTRDIVAAADIVVSLDPEASGVLGRMSAHLPKMPTILDRHALNPWGMDAAAHERAYDQIAATCTEVLQSLRHTR